VNIDCKLGLTVITLARNLCGREEVGVISRK